MRDHSIKMAKLLKVFQHTQVSVIVAIALFIARSSQTDPAPAAATSAHNAENVTKLTKVEPPATSSMADLMNMMLRTSPAIASNAMMFDKFNQINNCTLLNANLTGHDIFSAKVLMGDMSNFRDGSASSEDPDGSPFGVIHAKCMIKSLSSTSNRSSSTSSVNYASRRRPT